MTSERSSHGQQENSSRHEAINPSQEKGEQDIFSREEISHIQNLQERARELKERAANESDIGAKANLLEDLRDVNNERLGILRRLKAGKATGSPETGEASGDWEQQVEGLIEEGRKPIPEGCILVRFKEDQRFLTAMGMGGTRYVSLRQGRKIVILDREVVAGGTVPELGVEYIAKVRDTQPGVTKGALIATELLGISPQEKLKQLMKEKGYVRSSDYSRINIDTNGRKTEKSLEAIKEGARRFAESGSRIVEDVRILPFAEDSRENFIGEDHVSAWVKYEKVEGKKNSPTGRSSSMRGDYRIG